MTRIQRCTNGYAQPLRRGKNGLNLERNFVFWNFHGWRLVVRRCSLTGRIAAAAVTATLAALSTTTRTITETPLINHNFNLVALAAVLRLPRAVTQLAFNQDWAAFAEKTANAVGAAGNNGSCCVCRVDCAPQKRRVANAAGRWSRSGLRCVNH